MLYIVIAYLWVSLYLYLILGGADFGVGIMEVFTDKSHINRLKNTSYQSIGPIWEANHMWLIIAVVVLFVGFPTIYSTLSIYLHIPLVFMLLGIIARGTAFTFRHYDAITDNWQKVYTLIFRGSSIITPFFLGLIAAATVSGYIDPNARDFYGAYIRGWWNPFGIAVGVFTVVISGYLASIYIIGEAEGKAFLAYLQLKARIYFFLVVLAGAAVFVVAKWSSIPLSAWILGGWIGQAALALAAVAVALFFQAWHTKKFLHMRFYAAFQVLMILIAATYRHFPDLVILANGESLSLFDHQGSEKTIQTLAWALMLGSLFIIPFLVYLLYKFQRKRLPG